MNIDGVKTNFNKFKILNNRFGNLHINILSFILCETNVTEEESEPYYLEGYNKFVQNRITKKDGTLKRKGSGIIIFLQNKYENADKYQQFCKTTPDFECLALKVTTNNEKFLIIGIYHPPSGNYNTFIELLDVLLENINSLRECTAYICGDFNVNLYFQLLIICNSNFG